VELAIEALTQRVALLPQSEDTEAAIDFLKQSDLAQVVPVRQISNCAPAEYWLRLYEMRWESTTKVGVSTYGFPSLLAALAKLPPSTPLTVTGFITNDWFGFFWSDQADRLVGFVLVKRRPPEQEQERLEWFRQNLT
jgi:hypothetical protein